MQRKCHGAFERWINSLNAVKVSRWKFLLNFFYINCFLPAVWENYPNKLIDHFSCEQIHFFIFFLPLLSVLFPAPNDWLIVWRLDSLQAIRTVAEKIINTENIAFSSNRCSWIYSLDSQHLEKNLPVQLYFSGYLGWAGNDLLVFSSLPFSLKWDHLWLTNCYKKRNWQLPTPPIYIMNKIGFVMLLWSLH